MVASSGNFPAFGFGRLSVAFGTAIKRLVPPRRDYKVKLTKYAFTCAGTAHTVTILAEQGRAKVAVNAASGDASFKIDADPGAWTGKQTAANNLAAADNIVLELDDGTFIVDTVSSVTSNSDGTYTVALTTNSTLPCAVSKGRTFWQLGITTDKDPHTGLAMDAYLGIASQQNVVGDGVEPVFNAYLPFSPIVLNDNNATATGAIDYVEGYYGPL